jgi:branched-chain amino acid transport system substrate-binding protein
MHANGPVVSATEVGPSRRQMLMQAASLAGATLAPSLARGAVSAASSDALLIGQTAAFSGPLGAAVKSVFEGSTLAFDDVNSRGGVDGRPIKLMSLDDGLHPDIAAANCRKLIEDERVLAMFGSVGGGVVQFGLPLLRDAQVPLVAPYALSDAARDKAKGVAYCVRASFAREFEVLAQQLTTIGVTRVGLAHLSVAVEMPELMRAALARHGLEPAAIASIGLDGSGFEAGISSIGRSRCQALILALDNAPAARLVKKLRAIGDAPAFYGLSLLDAEQLWKALDGHASGLVVAQVMPLPWNSIDPEIHAFQAACTKGGVRPSYHSIEGWMSARVLVEALRRAGPNPSRVSLLRSLRALRLRLAGMDIDFTSGTPTGSRFVELVQINEQGRFVR